MNVVLIGYRGTGKSTIARFLAREVDKKLIDIDDMIVQSAGMPIPKIVAEWGWPRFREIEARMVEEVTEADDGRVIDCGGGVILDPRNVRNLRENGKIVLLTASFDIILKRIRRDPNRPPLKEGLSFEEEQRQILEERKEQYEAAADLICNTTSIPPKQTVSKIIRVFKDKGWL